MGIEVVEVGELVGELSPLLGIRQDFAITVAFTPLHERRDECLIVVHGGEFNAARKMTDVRRCGIPPYSPKEGEYGGVGHSPPWFFVAKR